MPNVVKASEPKPKPTGDRRERRPLYAKHIDRIVQDDPDFLRRTFMDIWRSCEQQIAERTARQRAHDALRRAIERGRRHTYPAAHARYDEAAQVLLELVGVPFETMTIDRMFVREAHLYATTAQIAAHLKKTEGSVRTLLKEARRATPFYNSPRDA